MTVEARLKASRGLLVNTFNEVTVGFAAVFEVVKEFATLGKNHSLDCLHKITLLVPALSPTNAVHTLSPYYCKSVLILLFLLSLCLPSKPFPSVSGGETLYKFCFTAIRAT